MREKKVAQQEQMKKDNELREKKKTAASKGLRQQSNVQLKLRWIDDVFDELNELEHARTWRTC